MSTKTRVASPSAVLVRARCAHRSRRAATRRSRVEPARMGSSAGPAPAKKRFAVLDCEDAVKWDGHAIALSRLLGRAGETWEHHRCWSGELPDLREIHTYQGLVVTGSHYSTRDDHAHPWIGALKRLIAKPSCTAASRCTARASMPSHRRGAGGNGGAQHVRLAFRVEAGDGGVDRCIHRSTGVRRRSRGVSPDGAEKNGAERRRTAPQPAVAAVLQAHGDCVVSLPNGATLLGSSATAPVEMFALGEDVLAVQGHPELDAHADAPTSPISRARARRRPAAKSSLRLETDHITLVGVVRAFLRGDGSGSVEAGANADGGDQTGKEQTDTPETLRRHAEAARAALSDTKRPKARRRTARKARKDRRRRRRRAQRRRRVRPRWRRARTRPSRPPSPARRAPRRARARRRRRGRLCLRRARRDRTRPPRQSRVRDARASQRSREREVRRARGAPSRAWVCSRIRCAGRTRA